MKYRYRYLIIGGGLAGASAIEGIRQNDPDGSIGLLCAEDISPYNRPPLSKDLLWGKKSLGEIFVFDKDYYADHKVELHLKTTVKSINAEKRFVIDEDGCDYAYSKLLIATGGSPREFSQAHGAVHYFRCVKDYLALSQAIPKVQDFLIIGGGFIGAELAAGLSHLGKKVTMLLKGKTLLENIFPADLSSFVTEFYKAKGVLFVTEDEPEFFDFGEKWTKVITKRGKKLKAGWAIAGIGIEPETALGKSAGLQMDHGIIVGRHLQTSKPDIFAAGDLARFPCESLGKNIRLEHWDNAKAQGRCAGINMAGGNESYVYLPYFYSDLFDLGFEAVGKLDSKMKTISFWEVPFRKGVVVYLEEEKVKGVLLWGQPKILDWARNLITTQAAPHSVEELKLLIPVLSAV